MARLAVLAQCAAFIFFLSFKPSEPHLSAYLQDWHCIGPRRIKGNRPSGPSKKMHQESHVNVGISQTCLSVLAASSPLKDVKHLTKHQRDAEAPSG